MANPPYSVRRLYDLAVDDCHFHLDVFEPVGQHCQGIVGDDNQVSQFALLDRTLYLFLKS